MFRFRLEKILQLKSRLRDAKKAELGYVNHRISQLKEELYRIEDEMVSISFPEGVVSFDQLQEGYRTLEFLRERGRQIKSELEQLYQEREKLLNELVQMQKEVRVLEKLKERKSEEFRREMLRREVKRLDDFASRRFGSAGS